MRSSRRSTWISIATNPLLQPLLHTFGIALFFHFQHTLFYEACFKILVSYVRKVICARRTQRRIAKKIMSQPLFWQLFVYHFFCVLCKQKTLNFCNSIIMWKILLDVRLKLEIVTSLYITEILLRYFIELQWNIIE